MKYVVSDQDNTEYFLQHEDERMEPIPHNRAANLIKHSCGRHLFEGKMKKCEIMSREEYESSGRQKEDMEKMEKRNRELFGGDE